MSDRVQSLNVSKTMKVKELRKRIHLVFGVEPRLQRLLFKGNQLEDGCDLLTGRTTNLVRNVGIDVVLAILLLLISKNAIHWFILISI
jgi:hypothetical protein